MIGEPLSRVDGPLKVTGRATYAYEHQDAGQPLYGFILGATVGAGRVDAIDITEAQNSPGVRLVLSHENAPEQATPDLTTPWMYLRAYPVLNGPEIRAYGQPVACVVADRLEQARAAAALISVRYIEAPGEYAFRGRLNQSYAPRIVNAGHAPDTSVGDFEAGFEAAPFKIDHRVSTPYQCSQPLEPHACLAWWRNGELLLYIGTQMVDWARRALALTLKLDARRVHVHAPFVGGGFGSKLGIHSEVVLAALAARELAHPVKVAMTRQQMFELLGNRPASVQRVRLGAERDGRLVAFAHEVTMSTSPYEEYAEQTAAAGRGLYAAPHRLTRHRVAQVHLPRGEDVRGPGETPGLLAIESAMDSLAYALDMDPIELRVKNEPCAHPETGQAFSERRLVDCMREGARRFGWERRPARPASLRDGQWLVGYGMAAAIRQHFQAAARARVRLEPDGTAVIRTDLPDIGTGHYTVLAQVGADALGLPMKSIRVELGRSDYPVSCGSGGSWGAPSTGVAVHRACVALREKLVTVARGDVRSPLFGLPAAPVSIALGTIVSGQKSEPLAALVARSFPQGIEVEGASAGMEDDPNFTTYSQHTYGAHFVEVGVDVDTREVRLRRMLGVFAAGRVLNPKTARSQLIGGMIWGASSALHEEAVVDTRSGAFVNRDLAGYLIPAHADIPNVDALLLDGFDEKANLLGIKGMGEVAICGAGAAVANAVFNATGIRVLDFPITIEKLLPDLR